MGRMVNAIRGKLDDSVLKESKIIAADVAAWSRFERNFTQDVIRSATTNLSGVSFHQYYLSKTGTWTDLIHPSKLNKLQDQISTAQRESYVGTQSRYMADFQFV